VFKVGDSKPSIGSNEGITKAIEGYSTSRREGEQLVGTVITTTAYKPVALARSTTFQVCVEGIKADKVSYLYKKGYIML